MKKHGEMRKTEKERRMERCQKEKKEKGKCEYIRKNEKGR